MKLNHRLVLVLSLFLFACQPATPSTVTIIDGDQVTTLQIDQPVLAAILTQAGISLSPNDTILLNGLRVAIDQPLAIHSIIQIRRAVRVALVTSDGQQTLQTSAYTVGEILQEAGIQFRASDKVDPPLNSPVTNEMTITVAAARTITVRVDGQVLQIQSSARTVSQALAEAGIPLLELDYSLPSENEALPSDGQVKVVRVNESVILAQKSIPFETEMVASADVPLDQTQILSPGENGLSIQRIRVRYEDGQEISRVTEDETMVRPPKTRTLAYGTKVEIMTTVVDGVTIEYWRAVQMYATSYSPCNLGTSTCGSTTASGKQLKKGMVALRTDLFFALRGQPVYIPGYGFATVEDACGGCVGKPWIDLGFTDADYEPWHSWVTVYFLTPVPQTIVFDFQ